MMTTNFYHVPRSFEPTFEFYRPAPTEMFKATDAARRHYETGGLFLRPIKKKIKIIGFDPARDADESVAVVKIKLSSGGEQTFTFDKREIDAMKAGEPLNWERIANSGVLPDGARLPSNIRRAVIGKLLESFEI